MDQSTEKKKRERSKNYLEEEKENLLNIVNDYLHIIENKKTDAVTSREKMKTWNCIAEKYNSNAKTGERNGCQLKLLYESMKKFAKKHKANDKVETYKTGSGSFIPSTTNTDNKVIAMLEPIIYPLKNPYDSNSQAVNIEIDDTVQPDEIHSLVDIVFCIDIECSDANPEERSNLPSTSAPTTEIKKNFFGKLKKKIYKKDEYLTELIKQKTERHNKKMEILEIIKQKEILELKLLERQLSKP